MKAIRRASICLLAATGAFAASPQFVSPQCGKTLGGSATLQVTGTAARTAQVVYSMGSHQIAVASSPPFSASWNSAEAMDGDSAIQAVARDANGREIGSAECLVTVSNRRASLHLNSPDLTQALSGTATISVTGSDQIAFPAVWTLNVDGEGQSTVWTDNDWKNPVTVTFSLDTTRFANGSHEMHISMDSRSGPTNPQWVNWRGMINRVVQFDNGHAWMDVEPQWQNMYLAPGDELPAGCTRLYTDGVAEACEDPVFTTTDPGILAVDANGNLNAGNAGFTQLTVTEGSKSATANVWIDNDHDVPHFGANGEMLRGYSAGKSLFVIAPFFLDADLLSGDPSFADAVRQAGINTLGFGVYVNPRDITADYTGWQTNYDQTVAAKMQWAGQNGFHLLLTGDDIFRRIAGDAWFTLNWPYGQQAVQYAMTQFAATGAGIGIEAIDEASSIWGPRPVPAGNLGQASYVWNEIDCVLGLCTAQWPTNGLADGTPFTLIGSATSGLNTPDGDWFLAQSVNANGFQFTAPEPVTGTFTAATDPTLEYMWFAADPCSTGIACTPLVPNDALATMRGWMIAGENGIHMAFPPLAVDSAQVHGAWMGPGSVSDYASNYFSSLKTRTTYPWSEGIQESISSMEQLFTERQPYLMLDRPQLMEVSLAGPSYTKQSTGSATYQPGVDALDQPGVGPDQISAGMMAAAALGGAGIRLYYFEPASDFPSRASSPNGASLQTGCNPSNLQVSSWQSMSNAANLLTSVLQPYLLSTAGNSPALGRNIVSAVRSSGDGEMLLAVNGNDWPRTITVDLTPYAFGRNTTQYLVSSGGVSTSKRNGNMGIQTITLAAGQTVVFLFEKAKEDVPLNRANSRF